jgi:predicted dithiol-disulfide oxidoreductase (DUF899 family)
MKKTPHPKIVSREKWLAVRKKLLGDEKKVTKQHDTTKWKSTSFPFPLVMAHVSSITPMGNRRITNAFASLTPRWSATTGIGGGKLAARIDAVSDS